MMLRYLPICEPCIRGEGSECHTPECALFMRDVPPDGLIEAFAATHAPAVDELAGKSLAAYTAEVRADERRKVAEEIAARCQREADENYTLAQAPGNTRPMTTRFYALRDAFEEVVRIAREAASAGPCRVCGGVASFTTRSGVTVHNDCPGPEEAPDA